MKMLEHSKFGAACSGLVTRCQQKAKQQQTSECESEAALVGPCVRESIYCETGNVKEANRY